MARRTDSPAAPPPRSTSDTAAISVGMAGSAHGVPVWDDWYSRVGIHGRKRRPPTARAPATRSEARHRARSPARWASPARASRPMPAAAASHRPQ